MWLCRVVDRYQHLGGTRCFHLHGVEYLTVLSWMWRIKEFSKMLVPTRFIQSLWWIQVKIFFNFVKFEFLHSSIRMFWNYCTPCSMKCKPFVFKRCFETECCDGSSKCDSERKMLKTSLEMLWNAMPVVTEAVKVTQKGRCSRLP
jgi:hypothetical protein